MIVRSGQPLIGANKRRCKADEDLLQAVIQGSNKGFVIDTRSSQQAQQARMAGGGFESKSSYSCWKRLHRQMERCARARTRDWMLSVIVGDQSDFRRRRGKPLQESLIKLVEACGDTSHNMDRWLSKLENSKWLSHVQTALSTAGLLAECVER